MPSSPFPSPDELDQQQRAAASGETERLRELVRTTFSEQRPAAGSAYSIRAQGYSELAVETVIAELRSAGWHVRRGEQRDLPGEFFVTRQRTSPGPTSNR